MSEELLPCPFCGSDILSVEKDDEYYNAYHVSCDSCGSTSASCFFDYDTENKTEIANAKNTAIKNWNKRTNNPNKRA